jgi:rSAM/selenodomain-associated transferase 1
MSTALVIFAKAPVAGLAKTRLIPALGAQGAADVARRLLAHTLAQAAAALGDDPSNGITALELCVTPDEGHPMLVEALNACAARVHLSPQGGGDLGERMHRTTTRALRTHERVLLIGTDAPALDAKHLRQAAHSLQTHDAVFVPATDGGYALVGLRRPAPELFADMPWSTPQVMALTRERARAAGLSWQELAPVSDVDEPDDLVHLPWKLQA